MFKWKEGRQRTGYRVMKLFQVKWPMPMDAYLIHYPVGSFVNTHIDPVPMHEHWRFNIVLKRNLRCNGFYTNENHFEWWRFIIFRSDRYHSVFPVTKKSRWVLSFGYCKKITTE